MAVLDKETGWYLANKSKEMLEKQTSIHRQKQANAATIIGVNALFVPFFLSGLSDSLLLIKLIAIIPILGLGTAIFLLLRIYMLKPLDQGLAISKYNETINKRIEEVLIFEIAVNKDSYQNNNTILEHSNKTYSGGVNLTMFSIFISILLLLGNVFFKPTDNNIKIEILKSPAGLIQLIKSDSAKTIIIPITQPNERESIKQQVKTQNANEH